MNISEKNIGNKEYGYDDNKYQKTNSVNILCHSLNTIFISEFIIFDFVF